MIYKIIIPNMHCLGCVNLMKVSLEETFKNVNIDLSEKVARFESLKDIDGVKDDLQNVFEELQEAGYYYTELKN